MQTYRSRRYEPVRSMKLAYRIHMSAKRTLHAQVTVEICEPSSQVFWHFVRIKSKLQIHI